MINEEYIKIDISLSSCKQGNLRCQTKNCPRAGNEDNKEFLAAPGRGQQENVNPL